MTSWKAQDLPDVQKTAFKGTAYSWHPSPWGEGASFLTVTKAGPARRGNTCRSWLFATRPASLRQQPVPDVLAFLSTIIFLLSPYPRGLHGGWLFPRRSSLMISWVTPFSLYLFDIWSHFLFGNIWGFNEGGTCPALLPFLSIQLVLCAIDSGCDSVTDTETEDEKVLPYSKQQSLPPPETPPGNLMVVQPERIRCGVGTSGGAGWMSEHELRGFSVDVVKGTVFSCHIFV